MAYIILYTYIWCLPKKFPNTCFIWKANGGSKFSQCAEISWIKIRMCLEVCQLLPPICYKKSLLVKKEPVDTSTKLWTRSRWGSNFPKLFRIDGKKNMKKTNSLALKYPKVVASFYIQTFHPEKTLLDKKKKTVIEISTPMKTANSSLGNHHPDELASCDAKIDTLQWTITKGWGSIQEGLEGRKGWMQDNGKPRVFPGAKTSTSELSQNDVCCCFCFK